MSLVLQNASTNGPANQGPRAQDYPRLLGGHVVLLLAFRRRTAKIPCSVCFFSNRTVPIAGVLGSNNRQRNDFRERGWRHSAFSSREVNHFGHIFAAVRLPLLGCNRRI